MANWTGKVVAVHVGEQGQPLRSVEAAEAVAGVGLEGDRYAQKAGTFSKKHAPDREITLIEMEALTALERDYAIRLTALASRRNVATEGVPLNHLVGQTFRVGGATVRGLRLCEPCGHLQERTGEPQLVAGLRHRGGLRAQIVTSGTIRPGDPITLEG